MIKDTVGAILLCLYVFSPRFELVPVAFSHLLTPVAAIYLVVLVCCRRLRGINAQLLLVLTPTLLVGCLLLFVPILHQTFDFTVPFSVIYLTSQYLLISLFLWSAFFREKVLYKSVKLIFLAFLLQAVFIFLMMISKDFKGLVLSVVNTRQNILQYYDFRYLGITGFANYTVGVAQALGTAIGVCLLSRRFSPAIFLATLLVLASAVVSARSSLIFMLYAFIALVLYRQTRKCALTVATTAAMSFFAIAIVLKSNTGFASYALKWAFEPLLYLQGSARLGSLGTLHSWYLEPLDNEFFTGTGNYTNALGNYYRDIDAGYLRLLLYFGMVPSVLFYTMYAVLFFLVYRAIYKAKQPEVVRAFRWFFVIVPITFYIFNLKGSFFVDGSPLMRTYILLTTIILQSRNIQVSQRMG